MEGVCEGFAGSDGALGHGGDAVLPGRALLEEAVPVDRSALLRAGDVVADLDLDDVSPVCLDCGARERAVDQEDFTLIAVGSDDATTNGPVIVSDDSSIGTASVGIGPIGSQEAPWESSREGAPEKEREKRRKESSK